jgi:hypothetical protein
MGEHGCRPIRRSDGRSAANRSLRRAGVVSRCQRRALTDMAVGRRRETNMSKRQGNREVRKPKAEKPKAAAADTAVSVLGKGSLEPLKPMKKKKS